MFVPELKKLHHLKPKSNRRIIDAHTHAWPPRLHQAILGWFDRFSWPIIYRENCDHIPEFLCGQGLDAWVVMAYAHKANISRSLNRWLFDYRKRHPKAVVLASVHPDDDDPIGILKEAVDIFGLAGIKLHNHVMSIAPEDPCSFLIYEFACSRDLPLVLNAGREPNSDGYLKSTHLVGGYARIKEVMARFPTMRCCIPHMAMDEWDAIPELFGKYPLLMLDTTLCLANYFPNAPTKEWVEKFADRIMYGSDYPILPYEYDREWRSIEAMGLTPEAEDALFFSNAEKFYKLKPTSDSTS